MTSSTKWTNAIVAIWLFWPWMVVVAVLFHLLPADAPYLLLGLIIGGNIGGTMLVILLESALGKGHRGNLKSRKEGPKTTGPVWVKPRPGRREKQQTRRPARRSAPQHPSRFQTPRTGVGQ